MNKVRVMSDWNSTPVCGPNPLWINDGKNPPSDPDLNGQNHWIRRTPLAEYACTNLGYEKVQMQYGGLINYTPSFMNSDLTPKALTYDAQRKIYNVDQSAIGNFSDPPQELQVKMLSALSNLENPFPLDGTKTPRYIPSFFDLESPTMLLPDGTPNVQNMVNALTWAKSLKADSAVAAFGWPSHKATQEEFDRGGWKAFRDIADYACGGDYNWDVPTANPNTWFEEIDMQTKLLDEFYSGLPRVGFLCPLYQIYFSQNDMPWVTAKNNLPVDAVLWKKMCQYLVDRDYHLYIWLGGTPNNAATQNLLKIANGFQI